MQATPEDSPASASGERDGQAPDLLFVYGTLRRDGANDIARLVPTARLVAQARMRGRLFDLGSYPAMVVDVDASWVKGEIYAVPADGWEALDALEDVVCALRPDGEYFRVLASALASGGRLRLCHVYVANPEVVRLDRPIESGDWLRHMVWRAG